MGFADMKPIINENDIEQRDIQGKENNISIWMSKKEVRHPLYGLLQEDSVCNEVLDIMRRISTLARCLGRNSATDTGLFSNLQVGLLLSLVTTVSQCGIEKCQEQRIKPLSAQRQIHILVVGDCGGIARRMMTNVAQWMTPFVHFTCPRNSELFTLSSSFISSSAPSLISPQFNKGFGKGRGTGGGKGILGNGSSNQLFSTSSSSSSQISFASSQSSNSVASSVCSAGVISMSKGGICFIPHANVLKKKDVEILYAYMRGKNIESGQQGREEISLLSSLYQMWEEEEQQQDEEGLDG
ncbi:MAG: hypothetical protein EZS28_041393, partial [Streblomastix strix]